jgi:hypothetical protein
MARTLSASFAGSSPVPERFVGMQQFDRDRAPVAQVARAVHRGHPASADLGIERVAVAECACRANVVVRHLSE